MKGPTRRHVLRGAGLALALPWLESLAPRRARGQAAPARRRFVSVFFPGGAAGFWKPAEVGQGDAWRLSPILEPLAPLEDHVTVLSHVDQTAYGAPTVIPGDGPLTGSFLTGAPCGTSPSAPVHNGISIDQSIALRIAQNVAGGPPLQSLEVGLATTLDPFCDGAPCTYGRSIAWRDAESPLFKLVDPRAVFDRIMGAGHLDPAPAVRRAGRKSVLDFVDRNAAALQRRLGRSDRERVEQFLAGVRSMEMRVEAANQMMAACRSTERPALSVSAGNEPPGYDRNAHADLMIDLIVMALSCDVTRVVTFMLDDARSSFTYGFLQRRHFTEAESTPTTASVGSYAGALDGGAQDDDRATINRWFVSKLAALCGRLAAIPEGDGGSLLDGSVVWFGSGQQGQNGATGLPVLYVGGGGGRLKVGWSLDFAPAQRLSNVYLTFLRDVFEGPDAAFGDSTGPIPELRA